MKSSTTRSAAAAHTTRRLSVLALCINATLSLLKIIAGHFGSSQAVAADGVHSLSDCATDIILIIGVKYWSKPPDENHPYGHKRIETIISIVVGLALVAAAVGLGANAVSTFNAPPDSPPTMVAFAAALVSIFVKELLYQHTVKVGKKIKSNALQANAWHQRSDALSSVPVALSVVAVWVFPGFNFIDNVGAILVSMFILHAAWQIVRPNLGQLADESASKETVEQIEFIARGVAGVEDIHALRTRRVGADVFVDLHVLVDKSMTIEQGHTIAGVVKQTLKESNDTIEDVLVHIEPH